MPLSEIEEYGQNADVLGLIGAPSPKTIAGCLKVRQVTSAMLETSPN